MPHNYTKLYKTGPIVAGIAGCYCYRAAIKEKAMLKNSKITELKDSKPTDDVKEDTFHGRESEPLPPVIRTFAGIRGALFDEMDRLRNGETDPKTANAIARLGATMVASVKMELEAARILKEGSHQDLTLPLLSSAPKTRK